MNRSMLSLCLCLLLTLFAVAAAGAEEKDDGNDNALLFEIRGLDNIGLESFDGGFGFRYFVSDNYAVRPSFHYGTALSTQTADDFGTTIDQDSYGVDLVVEKHLATPDRVSPYLGIGVSFGESTRETTYSEPAPLVEGDRTGTRDETEYRAALGVIGVQWRACSALSLGCEYQMTYRYSKSENTGFYYESEPARRYQESKSFGYSTSSLFLAVRF